MTLAHLSPPPLSRTELRRRWIRTLGDPVLADIPGKLELNEKGRLELTPSSNRHALVQAFIAGELRMRLARGAVFTECSVETRLGVRVPDVAWASPRFMQQHRTTTPFPEAPDLCIEVQSPSNSDAEMNEKAAAYLAAGAIEVWIVAENGVVRILDTHGTRDSSSFGIELILPD